MKLTIAVPIHDGSQEQVEAVLQAAHHNADELLVVADRPPADIMARLEALQLERGRIIRLDGPPGWRSPCVSYNAALEAATGDIFCTNHGDVVQGARNGSFLRQAMLEAPAVYFGHVLESDPDSCRGTGHAGPVLCASFHPRALTFLTAAPTQALRGIGGWDLDYMAGVCYEDDDLTARLWKHTGLPFIFDDALNGVHQSHPRGYFRSEKLMTNMQIMLEKHGTTEFFHRESRNGRLDMLKAPGRMTWTRKEPTP